MIIPLTLKQSHTELNAALIDPCRSINNYAKKIPSLHILAKLETAWGKIMICMEGTISWLCLSFAENPKNRCYLSVEEKLLSMEVYSDINSS